MYIDKEDLLNLLKDKYGELGNDRGCYINNTWFTIYDVVELIEECTEYDC